MAAAGQRRLYRTWFPPDELTREEIVSQKCSLICVHLIAMFFTRKVSTTLQNCCMTITLLKNCCSLQNLQSSKLLH